MRVYAKNIRAKYWTVFIFLFFYFLFFLVNFRVEVCFGVEEVWTEAMWLSERDE